MAISAEMDTLRAEIAENSTDISNLRQSTTDEFKAYSDQIKTTTD